MGTAHHDAASAGRGILAFRGVSVEAADRYDSALRDATLELKAGELAFVLIAADSGRLSLADLAAGLVAPAEGAVLFLGEAWSDLTASEAARRRGGIGWFFPEETAWVSNLTVRENVLLARRHHTRDDERALAERADLLGRRFGLRTVPTTRPAWTSRADLRRAQWVRALLGEPVLLLLERPAAGASEADRAGWFEAVAEARRRGAAVLWLTDDTALVNRDSLHPTWKFKLEKEGLRPI